MQLAGRRRSVYEYDEATESLPPPRDPQDGRGAVEALRPAHADSPARGRSGPWRLVARAGPVPDIGRRTPIASPLRAVLLQLGYRARSSPCRCCEKRAHRRADGQRQDAGRLPAGGRRAPPDLRHPVRVWPSRTPACSARSQTRVGSLRPRATTSPSSWPTCPTSSERR